jgi:gliding motility-associated-like protein
MLTWTQVGEYDIVARFESFCPVPPETYRVIVLECAESAIYFPNAFTPNGDGINEGWSPVGFGITKITWTVWNRWGQQLFESDCVDGMDPDGYCKKWPGVYKGTPCQQDVYVFKAEWEDASGKRGERVGKITLVR